MKTQNCSRHVAGIILGGTLAMSALLASRTEAANATTHEIRKIGESATTTTTTPAAAKGTSEAPLKEKLANIDKFNKDLLTWKPNAADAAERKARLKSELVATLRGKQTPSAESVDKLAGDTIDFAAAGKLTPKDVLAIQKAVQAHLDKHTLNANSVDAVKAEVGAVTRASVLTREEAGQLAQDAEALIKSARANAPPRPKLEGLKGGSGSSADSQKLGGAAGNNRNKL